MSSQEYPLKHIRLQQLYDAGFNVANFICFAPGTLVGREKELEAFLQKHGRISCRHFHAEEKKYFKCPVEYDQTDFNFILNFCMRNNYGRNEYNEAFYTLCNEAINPNESLCAGNILVHDEYNYFIEYFYGSGTPRDIEKKVDILKTYSKTYGESARGDRPPEEVLKFSWEARKFNPLNKAYIMEFSLYPYPIGKRQTNVICWEWRWGWLHYQLQANQYLLEQLKRANARIDELEKYVETLHHSTGSVGCYPINTKS